MGVCMYLCICMYVCIYVCMYVCIYVYIYIYTYICIYLHIFTYIYLFERKTHKFLTVATKSFVLNVTGIIDLALNHIDKFRLEQ